MLSQHRSLCDSAVKKYEYKYINAQHLLHPHHYIDISLHFEVRCEVHGRLEIGTQTASPFCIEHIIPSPKCQLCEVEFLIPGLTSVVGGGLQLAPALQVSMLQAPEGTDCSDGFRCSLPSFQQPIHLLSSVY
jgi:hypothetical protein